MSTHLIKFCYRLRKPRIRTENIQSLTQYRRQLRQARRQVHQDVAQYQQQIENLYLQKHKQQTYNRHLKNKCDFRKNLMQGSHRLLKQMNIWRKQDAKYQQKLQKYLHDSDIRRINRNRIKKIMEYQSQNYWFTAENIHSRLNEQVIFPNYIANTYYYHQLHAQALAYQNLDFKTVHEITSNQSAIQRKNKILMPLFAQIKTKIANFKNNQFIKIKKQHQKNRDEIYQSQYPSQIIQSSLKQEQYRFQSVQRIQKDRMKNPEERKKFLLLKTSQLVSIMYSWKRYTNILGMTSAEIIKDIEQQAQEYAVEQLQSTFKSGLDRSQEPFIDLVEQDTEDDQISLENYIDSIRDKEQLHRTEESIENQQLNKLLAIVREKSNLSSNKNTKNQKEQIQLPKQNRNFLGSITDGSQQGNLQIKVLEDEMCDQRNTTSTVEFLKQMNPNDEKMQFFLNQLGQVHLDYPQLFKKVWDSIYI